MVSTTLSMAKAFILLFVLALVIDMLIMHIGGVTGCFFLEFWLASTKLESGSIHGRQTLETKFCWPQRQCNYHFEMPDGADFVIQFEPKKFMMSLPFILSEPIDKEMKGWPIRRRPLMASLKPCPEWPPIKTMPFVVSFPSHWTPLDTSRDWEVVKLWTNSEEYKQVTSEFIKSFDSDNNTKRKVKEVFRVQNSFIWQKYVTKRNFMEANGNLDERYLYHGTQMESCIKGIFHHNFDMRCYCVNNFVYGKGIYFAVRAGLSDRYAYNAHRRRNWMFLSRVLVGKYETGKREYSRPPNLGNEILLATEAVQLSF